MAKKRIRLKRPSKAKKKIGLAPGTVTYMGDKEDVSLHLEVIDYNKDRYSLENYSDVTQTYDIGTEDSVTWTNLTGINNVEDIKKLGLHYNIHPLILEDIVDPHQRPKIDEFEEYVFVVAKMLYYKNEELVVEHISIIMGENYVLTFQESEHDVFDGLRKRLEAGKGRIRTEKSDYLLFCILDSIIDNYFLIIESLSEKIEDMEDQLFRDPEETSSQQIQDLKREALRIRKSIFPLREVLNRLEKVDANFIYPQTNNYFKDLYDNIVQVIETIELYREMIWGLIDMYMSTISNKMNNVMKVLTIIATIFIPLTFIAGIYGMNFDNMPELHYKYGYHVVWGVMLLIFILMIYYFKRKKWL
ncbi:magnesium/cobalt transporter CorA [Neptunitalea lumnitzerae]|uniref:Magnesium transport protein CorA n=1 Tax=Neptunitalea lumnitzerae TaxID=2965509 RepID=A0ABQ5ML23_9FLAO|nr:magnesium/cobalt transporter CorA [Neptunitalea sp. Y10]GLB49647.1 magnesium and cobalt transport protein CorA [Neptunitalea sp. Y10]